MNELKVKLMSGLRIGSAGSATLALAELGLSNTHDARRLEGYIEHGQRIMRQRVDQYLNWQDEVVRLLAVLAFVRSIKDEKRHIARCTKYALERIDEIRKTMNADTSPLLPACANCVQMVAVFMNVGTDEASVMLYGSVVHAGGPGW